MFFYVLSLLLMLVIIMIIKSQGYQILKNKIIILNSRGIKKEVY